MSQQACLPCPHRHIDAGLGSPRAANKGCFSTQASTCRRACPTLCLLAGMEMQGGVLVAKKERGGFGLATFATGIVYGLQVGTLFFLEALKLWMWGLQSTVVGGSPGAATRCSKSLAELVGRWALVGWQLPWQPCCGLRAPVGWCSRGVWCYSRPATASSLQPGTAASATCPPHLQPDATPCLSKCRPWHLISPLPT